MRFHEILYEIVFPRIIVLISLLAGMVLLAMHRCSMPIVVDGEVDVHLVHPVNIRRRRCLVLHILQRRYAIVVVLVLCEILRPICLDLLLDVDVRPDIGIPPIILCIWPWLHWARCSCLKCRTAMCCRLLVMRGSRIVCSWILVHLSLSLNHR